MEEIIMILTSLFHWDLSRAYCAALFVCSSAIYGDSKYSKTLYGVEDSYCPPTESEEKVLWRWREKETELTF